MSLGITNSILVASIGADVIAGPAEVDHRHEGTDAAQNEKHAYTA